MSEPSYHDLLQENQQLRQQLATALGQVAGLETKVAELAGLLEEARRAGKRQAAPFRKGPPKAQPNTPGRKSGDAHGRRRPARCSRLRRGAQRDRRPGRWRRRDPRRAIPSFPR